MVEGVAEVQANQGGWEVVDGEGEGRDDRQACDGVGEVID